MNIFFMTTVTTGVPDDLLTAPPDSEQLRAAVEEVKKVDISTTEKRAEVKRLLVSLRDAEVWSLLKAYFRGNREQIQKSIISCTLPNELLKYSGELKKLDELLNWPEMMISTIQQLDMKQSLKDQREKEKANERPPEPFRR